MKIKTKIVSGSVLGIILTAVALLVVVIIQKQAINKSVVEQMDVQAKNQCGAIARDVWLMLNAQNQSILKKVKSNLAVARETLNNAGAVTLTEEKVAWKATNQVTNEIRDVELPKMMVGKQWLGQNTDMAVASPVVDKVKELVGGTCTVFQRINDQGDMLRVCTTMPKTDGSRGIGSYIPAVNANGQPNPIVAALIKGESTCCRNYVVNTWFTTMFEPIFNDQKKVIGAICAAMKQEDIPEVRQGIMGITVGKTGYVYVLGGKGEQKGQYVISKDGKRDGENIWEAKDADGKLFIQSVITKGLTTKDGQSDYEYYPWQNQGESKARLKIVAVTYFEPWDWVIGAGTYQDDFLDAIGIIESYLNKLMTYSGLGAILTTLIFGTMTFLVARNVIKRIGMTAGMLKELSQGDGDLTKRFEVNTSKRGDEITQLEHHFNEFVNTIHTLVKKIAGTASTVAGASTELSATSNQMAGNAEEMSQQSSTVAAAAEEMATNMTKMAAAGEQMSTNVKTVAAAVEEMTASISEVAKNAEQAAGVADRASNLTRVSNEKIGQLGTAADEIGKVIEVIQDIAEQTNLLALNATIEAARAGEAGKGFAVVAIEVKELAKQTAEATEDISRRIAAIQSSTGESVDAIGQISKVIEEVNGVSRTIASAVEQQSATTKEIAQNVSQVASASEMVSRGVAESATASQEITKNIAGVDTAAKQTAQGAAQTQTAGAELSKMAEELQSLVGKFKV
jgi:methyl-accepting chemotaxis protein